MHVVVTLLHGCFIVYGYNLIFTASVLELLSVYGCNLKSCFLIIDKIMESEYQSFFKIQFAVRKMSNF